MATTENKRRWVALGNSNGSGGGNSANNTSGTLKIYTSPGIQAKKEAEAAAKAASGDTTPRGYITAEEHLNRNYYDNVPKSNLSAADASLLNAEQQKQIEALKEQYAAAATQDEKDKIHQLAEDIRQTAGYSGGSTGAGYDRLGANAGGMTADQMAQWLADYQYTNYIDGLGWTNGYSTAMNVRSKANQIRQQMLANEQAQANADAATKKYLHEQNLALAQLLYQYTGQTEKNTYYNDQTGRWETWNSDVGYGYNMSHTNPLTYEGWTQDYGYTDEQIQNWANDTSLYYNFVDPRAANRNKIDESVGYTGKYAQFINGPYAALLSGGTHNGTVNPATYMNVTGDGFYDNSLLTATPKYDANGNLIQEAPPLKNNNAMTDYTNQFTSYVANGVIQPGVLSARNGVGGNGAYSHVTGGGAIASDPRYTGAVNRDLTTSTPQDPNNSRGQLEYYENYGQQATNPLIYSGRSSGITGGSDSGAGGYEDYINQMYAAALEAQMAQLESSYKQNLSDLDTAVGTIGDTYTEQKRQTTGTNAQQAAAWREMANAYGLNSGAIGQAALAQSNQLQSNLNTLESAQAAALTEIEQQRTLLGQQYQLAINQALAENNFNKADALYQEAVRQDELLLQKQQMAIQTALQVAQMAMQQSQFQQGLALDYAKLGLSGSSGRSGGSGGSGVVDTSKTLSSNDALYAKLYAAADKDANPQNFIAANYKDYGFSNSSGLWAGYQDWAENAHSSDDIIDRLNNTTYQSADNTTASALTAQLKNDMSLTNEQKLNVAQMAYQNGHISSRQLTQMLDSLGL